MIEEPGADIQAEPEGQAGPPECYPSAGAQHPKETECSGQDSGGSIFSVTSYRKTQMKFLANFIAIMIDSGRFLCSVQCQSIFKKLFILYWNRAR